MQIPLHQISADQFLSIESTINLSGIRNLESLMFSMFDNTQWSSIFEKFVIVGVINFDTSENFCKEHESH